MTASEVINFILPQSNDPIQMVFLAIIVTMMLGTGWSAHRYAHATSWEKKWNRGTPDDNSDDLDIEHGSVTDLSHAVATAPEKLLEIMPGMLLVVGLLGTFLGLGMALNNASNILGHANAMSAGAAADSMNQLMGLLQGLGTKFKTSTWGIAGFVMLKVWSEYRRFEETRLAWVIGKVKTELDRRKLAAQQADVEKRNQLQAQITAVSDNVVAGLAEQVGKLMQQNTDMHQQSLAQWQANLDGQREGLAEQTGKLMLQHKEMHQQSLAQWQANLEGQREALAALQTELCATKETMQLFTRNTEGVIERMAMAAQQMVAGAGDIGRAAERMAEGADKVGAAGEGLVGAIDEFKREFGSVLNDVRTDLGKAIQDMSTQAADTLAKGSQQLSSATKEISTALGELSNDVNQVMQKVEVSITKALDIQKNASIQFSSMAGSLEQSIVETTSTVGKLAEPIEQGLTAISASNRSMTSVGKGIEKALLSMEDIVSKLEPLPDALSSIASLPAAKTQIIQQFIQQLQALRQDLQASQVIKVEVASEAGVGRAPDIGVTK